MVLAAIAGAIAFVLIRRRRAKNTPPAPPPKYEAYAHAAEKDAGPPAAEMGVSESVFEKDNDEKRKSLFSNLRGSKLGYGRSPPPMEPVELPTEGIWSSQVDVAERR